MSSPVILFDGVCNLCNGAVQFIIKKDTNSVFKFSSLQSDFSQNARKSLPNIPQSLDSIILLDQNKVYVKSQAVFKIIDSLPSYRFLKVFSILPVFVTDFVYDIIAKNRYRWFGKQESCMMPDPKLTSRFL